MKEYKKPKVFSASGAVGLVPVAAAATAAATSLTTWGPFAVGVAAGLGLSQKGDRLANIKTMPLRKVEQTG